MKKSSISQNVLEIFANLEQNCLYFGRKHEETGPNDFKTWNYIISRVLWKEKHCFFFFNLKFTKNNTFNNGFCDTIFSNYC